MRTEKSKFAAVLAGITVIATLSSVNPSFAQSNLASKDGYDDLRSKKSCRAMSSDKKIEKFARAWAQAVDDINMTKCFMTLTTQEQSKTWEVFVSLGGGAEAFEKKKPEILAERKQITREELLEFTDTLPSTSKNGSVKVVARPAGIKSNAFAPTPISVQYIGWMIQANYAADNWWQNNNCDGDGGDSDWEYSYFFGEPTQAHQFRVYGSVAPVIGLLSYYGSVIARAPGNGDVILCMGNGNGWLPAWYIAIYSYMWRSA